MNRVGKIVLIRVVFAMSTALPQLKIAQTHIAKNGANLFTRQ